jgi:hypothetical protein
LQPRVLRFGFLQDGDIAVGIFPQREKIFVGGERPNAAVSASAHCEVLDSIGRPAMLQRLSVQNSMAMKACAVLLARIVNRTDVGVIIAMMLISVELQMMSVQSRPSPRAGSDLGLEGLGYSARQEFQCNEAV